MSLLIHLVGSKRRLPEMSEGTQVLLINQTSLPIMLPLFGVFKQTKSQGSYEFDKVFSLEPPVELKTGEGVVFIPKMTLIDGRMLPNSEFSYTADKAVIGREAIIKEYKQMHETSLYRRGGPIERWDVYAYQLEFQDIAISRARAER